MKNLFLDKLYDAQRSVCVEEFKNLDKDLFKDISRTKEIGICTLIDTETTGLNHRQDEIIEVALRQWLYHKKEHLLIAPLKEYSELNEPLKNKISKEITKITGIKKEDVAGKKIDWGVVNQMISDSDFILAHNASFDRPMIESVSEVAEASASKIWVCSLNQVDWEEKGFLSAKQELLCIFHGFHYSGHRALTDIDALANLLLKGSYLPEILVNAKVKNIKVDCVRAPFESKDLLKAQGFFWDAPNKFWSKFVPEPELSELKDFLEQKVYPEGKMKAEFTPIELRDRFKA